MKSKLFSLIALLCTLLLLAVSCGNAPAERSSQGETPTNSIQPIQNGEITVDNYGRAITVTGTPEKVLTLGPNCTELFVALGLSEKVVGNSLNNHSRGPLPEYKEAYETIPEINHSSATREAVLSSGADFIYGIDWEFGDEALSIDELEDNGIIVYMNAAATLDEIYGEIRDLGTIFGAPEAAETFIGSQQARIGAVQEKVADEEPLSVLVYDSGNDGVFTCSGSNFESLLIEQAGGKNIFDDLTDRQWVTVSYEEVLARNPDVIIIHDYDSPSVEAKIEEIKSNPSLAQLDAVKNERFITIELESVLPGSRMAYSVERLAQGFFPDLSW